MNEDCRNDCTAPLLFPKRLNNRPGLAHLDYRIGAYTDIREALLRNLNMNPVLKGWSYRKSDDPGIALLEGAAILGDILTFYQELYSNEAYLRTARWRESIADLVRLLGYRLSPGLGGKATFAFEVKGDKSIVIPIGFKVNAQIEGSEQPVDFETIDEVVAYPALSKFNLYRPYRIPDITAGTKSFSIETDLLKEKGMELIKGDRLMLVAHPGNPASQRQVATIEKIQERFDTTEIYIKGSWQGSDTGTAIYAYKLGRSFRHFGYNGPLATVKVENCLTVQTLVDFSRKLGSAPAFLRDNFLQPDGKASIKLFSRNNPLENMKVMPLDTEVEGIIAGSTVLVKLQLGISKSVTDEEYFFERIIKRVTNASLTWGAISGGSTLVELDNNVVSGNLFYTDIRSVEFFEVVGEKVELIGTYGEDQSPDLLTLYYFGDLQTYKNLDKRHLLFVKEDGTYDEILVETSRNFPGNGKKLRPLRLSKPPENFANDDFPLHGDPAVTIYGNLVRATQGKTEKEAILGNGDSREAFQTFKLPKSPLTYLSSAGEAPPAAPELQIYVNDRAWKRVPSFFGRGPKEDIYIVREDSGGNSWVQFGDGKTGARLPSGLKNIIAGYRTGSGAHGALKEGTTTQAGSRLDGLDKIQLPGVVSGGSQPEDGDNAREAAPGKIQSLDRLVSMDDFERETLAIPGVSKVSASWEPVHNIPTVVLTVLMETGREEEFEDVRITLANYDTCRGSQRFPLEVIQGRLQYVHVEGTFALNPVFREEVVRKAIKEALGVTGQESTGVDGSRGLFGPGKRGFGQREYATKIEGTIQNVEGVVWAKVNVLGIIDSVNEPSDRSLPVHMLPLSEPIPCGSDRVLSLHESHLQLKASAATTRGVC